MQKRHALASSNISFTTFLKVALQTTTNTKISVVNGLHTGSGYDFYKQMKLAAREVAIGKTEFSVIEAKLSKIRKPAEREHNLSMVRACHEWWTSQKDLHPINLQPKTTFENPDWKFGIRLAPELVYEKEGEKVVTYLWALKLPTLTRQVAGMGLHILRQGFADHSIMPANFQILDLRRKKTFGEELITNVSPRLLSADAALLNSIWPDN